jgi:DNA gyrase subunit A
VDNQPRILTLKEILQLYIKHQKEVVIRRTVYDMRKAEERAHILEGLLVALDNIDEVIRVIRSQKTIPEARTALMERFSAYEVGNLLDVQGVDYGDAPAIRGLSEAQATAIVNMRFGQLTGLERAHIVSEYTDLRGKISGWKILLSSDENIFALIKEEMLAIKAKYNNPRRTEIMSVDDEIDIEDLIKEEDNVFTLTHFGYIKRLPVSTYRAQRRGGKGVAGLTTREEDFPTTLFIASTHDFILFFTSKGRMHRIKGYQIPESGRTAKGMNIVNLIPLESGEKVTAMIPVRNFNDGYLVTVTKNGIVKRVVLSTLDSVRRSGIRALAIDEEDELISVNLTDGKQEIVLATKYGLCIRFSEDDLRPMGRSARGVMGVRLSGDDCVIGASVIDNSRMILTVTENGYGKCTPVDEYRITKRYGKGIITHNLTEKTGNLCGIAMVNELDDLMLITNDGNIIRMNAESVRVCGRNSQGVILMRTDSDVKVISIAITAHEEPEEEQEAEGTSEAEGNSEMLPTEEPEGGEPIE